MQIVKSVGVLSVAKIMGLIYGCMGFCSHRFSCSSDSLVRLRVKARVLLPESSESGWR